jgi:hypothetical protein
MERGQASVDPDRHGPASMNCVDVRELFPDAFNRRLSPFQSVLFREHCAACAACRSEWRLYVRNALTAGRLTVSARILAQLGNLIFKSTAIKLSLEAAGLVLVLSLAFYAAHRLPGFHTASKQIVAVLRPAVNEAPVEPLPEITAEPQPVEVQAVKTAPASRALDKPNKPQVQTARSAQPRATPAPTKRFVDSQVSDTGTSEPNLNAGRDEPFAPTQPRDAEADRATQPSAVNSEVPAEAPAKDKTTPNPEESGAAGVPTVVPDDASYFFLYNPSMKPL